MSSSISARDDESIDGLLRNQIRVIQARKGYRVSEDALVLAWFVCPEANELILDAGTGCGVIAFALAVTEPTVHVLGVEIQSGLADRAGRGRLINSLEARVSIVRGDVRQADTFCRPAMFDCVVSNPPFHEYGRGRINPSEEKALARHQLMLPLVELFRVSRRLLNLSGRVCVIYPATGITQLQKAMKDAGFEPSRMLWIHTRSRTVAGLVCLEAKPAEMKPPLTEGSLWIYDENGCRTPEAEAILSGEQFIQK